MRRLLAVAVLALAACTGTDFTWDQARQIRPGMTEAELSRVMGKPFHVRSRGNQQVWTWTYVGAALDQKTVSAVLEAGRVVEAPTIPESF